MSWQAYVDTNLVGTGKFTQAAILGQAGGGSIWAKSSNLSITDAEARTIVKGFTNPDDFRAGGVHVASVKYMTLQADDDHVYGKKGPSGVAMIKTVQAILVGVYGEGIQPGDANKVIGDLGDYLKGQGY